MEAGSPKHSQVLLYPNPFSVLAGWGLISVLGLMIRYLGTSKTERYLYILLEYVAGGSLANMLKSGPLPEPLIQ